jgi:drug/metabolite transporter (DMT)-like permease
MVFGSIVGYSCFLYVLRHTSPTVTSTYYYANTVVAVLLGSAILGERITGRTVVAIVLVLSSVVWVQRAGRRRAHVT